MASDRGIISVLVLLDVSAVFDNVDHNILSQQFESTIGITSTRLQCLKSYLFTRLEFVHENVESYSHSKGNDRVPHGSVVGQILFIFHVSLRHIIHYQCYEDSGKFSYP